MPHVHLLASPRVETRFPFSPSRACAPWPRVALGVLILCFASPAMVCHAFSPAFQAGYMVHHTMTILPEEVHVADFNGDGIQDLIFSVRQAQGPMGVGLGRGDGTFLPEFLTNVVDNSWGDRVVFPDLDRNGKADIVQFTGTLWVNLGDGTATFGPSVNYGSPTPTGYGSLLAGDVDGDGWTDVGVASDTQLVVWRNHGDGTLEAFVTRNVGMATRELIDVNGDGKLDLAGAITGSSYQLSAALGHGDGTFDPPIPSAAGYPTDFGDLDGDGNVDAVGVPVSGPGPHAVYFGDGAGSFAAGAPSSLPGSLARILDPGDGTRVIVSVWDGIHVQTIHPDRTIDLERSYAIPYTSSELSGFVDFNGDGRQDIVGCLNTHEIYTTLLTDASGGYEPAPLYLTAARPMGMVLQDVNGDGKLDALTANASGGSIAVFLGDGNGHFAPRTDFPAGAFPLALALGDLTGDGVPDIAAPDSSANALQVVPGNGDGTYGAATPYSVGSAPRDVFLVDLNHDSRLDAVVANRASNTVTILRGLSDGTLGARLDLLTGPAPKRVAAGDLNGDGHPDVIAMEESGTGFRAHVFRGDGAGAFVDLGAFASNVTVNGSPFWGGMGLGDVNEDGKLDVVMAARTGLRYLPGIGDGTLGPAQTMFPATQGTSSMTIDDVDGDGKQDIAVAADFAIVPPWSGVASVYHANGGGSFRTYEAFGVYLSPMGIAVGDLNGDGAKDIVVADAGANAISVLIQKPEGVVAVLASIVSAEARPGSVQLAWQGPAYLAATVERRRGSGSWAALAPIVADASGRLAYEDRDITAGESYSYRLS